MKPFAIIAAVLASQRPFDRCHGRCSTDQLLALDQASEAVGKMLLCIRYPGPRLTDQPSVLGDFGFYLFSLGSKLFARGVATGIGHEGILHCMKEQPKKRFIPYDNRL